MSAVRSIELLRLLVARLERLSVDSRWAHRASGLRGNIIKLLEMAEIGNIPSASRMNRLINASFDILRHAGEEIPYHEL